MKHQSPRGPPRFIDLTALDDDDDGDDDDDDYDRARAAVPARAAGHLPRAAVTALVTVDSDGDDDCVVVSVARG